MTVDERAEQRLDQDAADCTPALVQRLRAVCALLQPAGVMPPPTPGVDPDTPGTLDEHAVAALTVEATQLLQLLFDHLSGSQDEQELWLLFTAVATVFPTLDQLADARRRLEHDDPAGFQIAFLRATNVAMAAHGSPRSRLDIHTGEVLVDVDFCARKVHHTGIQRVVRATVPHWHRDHEFTLVGWTDGGGCLRRIEDEGELSRVLHWGEHETDPPSTHDVVHRLVVPWNSRLVIVENLNPRRAQMLTALGQRSGTALTMIGYDCIPVVSPELVVGGLPSEFAVTLQVAKSCRTIAGISRSAAQEFEGFGAQLHCQGLPSPRVVEVSLPAEAPVLDEPVQPRPRPLVLTVGSFEPRKNQLALLLASERLWREGLEFDLQFVGGGGYRTEFDEVYAQLVKAGRPISVGVQITEAALWAFYRDARFCVFTSLHEGYGLPVAESLSYGVPVITTNFGSTAEIAEELGGCITVDPHDDEALADAMRRLLTDEALHQELSEQAINAPRRTWKQYADSLWRELVLDGGPA